VADVSLSNSTKRKWISAGSGFFEIFEAESFEAESFVFIETEKHKMKSNYSVELVVTNPLHSKNYAY
jgi:hypothetical protein